MEAKQLLFRPSKITGILAVLAIVVAFCSDPAEGPGSPPAVGTELGLTAPSLAGTAATNQPFDLHADGDSTTVLVFYQSAQCGLCRFQLERTQENLSAYLERQARVIGVTLDSPEASQTSMGSMPISFSLVSVDSSVFRTWGVLHPENGVPLPATYIVDANGLVRFRHVGRNASDRTTDAELITVLEGISGS